MSKLPAPGPQTLILCAQYPDRALMLVSKKVAVLQRGLSTREGTFGTLTVDKFSYDTGELPWADNLSRFSCIQPGHYICRYSQSPKFKKSTYLLENVWARTDIRIHSGNFVGDIRRGCKTDVEGCILLGVGIGPMNGQNAILRSRYAVASFEALMGKQDFLLVIKAFSGAQVL